MLGYLAGKQPLAGGPGSAGGVAAAARDLCEPASRFVTRALLRVAGGVGRVGASAQLARGGHGRTSGTAAVIWKRPAGGRE